MFDGDVGCYSSGTTLCMWDLRPTLACVRPYAAMGLQLPTCDRTFKNGHLVLVLNELQGVLPHPLRLSHPCATSTEQGLFPQGSRKENTLHTILLRP